MMTMAAMEAAIDEAFERPLTDMKYGWSPSMKRVFRDGFEDGFRSGVAWAQSQAKIEASSPAVGTTSQYQGEAEEPEEEA